MTAYLAKILAGRAEPPRPRPVPSAARLRAMAAQAVRAGHLRHAPDPTEHITAAEWHRLLDQLCTANRIRETRAMDDLRELILRLWGASGLSGVIEAKLAPEGDFDGPVLVIDDAWYVEQCAHGGAPAWQISKSVYYPGSYDEPPGADVAPVSRHESIAGAARAVILALVNERLDAELQEIALGQEIALIVQAEERDETEGGGA